MATLSGAQKQFIVRSLACFETPADVAKAVKEKFGLELGSSQIAFYDPTNAAGSQLSKELTGLFIETRKAFIEDSSAIAISHKTYRLRELDRLYQKNKDRSPKVAADLLEQAAKEAGGALTNRREVTGADGRPIAMAVTNVPSIDELRQLGPDELLQLHRETLGLSPED